MAIFSSADENDIKKRKAEQDRREAELDCRQAEIEHREKLIQKAAGHVRERQESYARLRLEAEKKLAAREQALFEREQDITQREIAAKTGFIEQQRNAFREAVDDRLHALDQRQSELGILEKRLLKELETLTAKEGELCKRELAVHEREQKADAGFADRARPLLESSEARSAACEKREKKLHAREAELTTLQGELEKRAEDLWKREGQLARAEQERDAGFVELRRQLEKELLLKRQSTEKEINNVRARLLAAVDRELSDLRAQRLAAVAKEEQAERERAKAVIDSERKVLENERQQAASEAAAARKELEQLRGSLKASEDEVVFREVMIEAKETEVERRASKLDDEIKRRIAQRQESFASREKGLEAELDRLRESLTRTDVILGCFEELKRRLGQDPEKVLLDLNSKTDELKRLKEELASRPTIEMRQQMKSLVTENKRLLARVEELEQSASEARQRLAGENDLRAKLGEAETSNKALCNRVEVLDAECSRLIEELKRMRAAYQREEDREARIRDIEAPHVEVAPAIKKKPDDIDEVAWLESIGKACIEYGLRFHPRILRAFHTALKTAEWSPLTVLAGVSGTGKSELPRLYAHFGGMPFLHLSVQPNWDSQESMLGFFNSIDNKFDAQPVLRFLAQSQKKNGKDYPGLQDAVCVVLLDEMNLAHAELYFAEFLSKLEFRRGLKGGDVPVLDVKLGAGLKPYPLPLGRNVLWAGTMNQDETTKSLSDKVLDRAIVIHFPRPMSLERREQLKPLPEAARLLPRKVWEGWWSRQSLFTDDDVRPYKTFIENMNTALSQVGRALGHRVWQSIEYYMSNYPDVRVAQKNGDSQSVAHAMRSAFEDQLVQKVMPKLRGIETRGRSKSECLDKIRAQLIEHGYMIVEDFDLACEFGYGQFIWQSANYLRETQADAPAEAAPPELGAPGSGTPSISSGVESPLSPATEPLTDPASQRETRGLGEPQPQGDGDTLTDNRNRKKAAPRKGNK